MKNRISVEDFRTIVRGLQAAYPRDNFLPNEYTFNLWYTTLQDIPYPTLHKAALNFISSSRFPPTIADMRALSHDLTAATDIIASNAWDQLLRALRMSWSPESVDVWNDLPDITKEIIGGYTTFRAWGNTDTGQLESVQRPMFIKRFEAIQERNRKDAAVIPVARVPRPALPQHCPSSAIEQKEDHPGKRAEPPEDRLAELRKRLRA